MLRPQLPEEMKKRFEKFSMDFEPVDYMLPYVDSAPLSAYYDYGRKVSPVRILSSRPRNRSLDERQCRAWRGECTRGGCVGCPDLNFAGADLCMGLAGV
jgi:hypothetical protein